jgi:SNF2 family DNA or RNA helicase
MGLGKTIQTLALIHEHYLIPSTRYGGTLIVAPLALIRQWEREVVSKSSRGLKVFVFHSRKKSKMELRTYDVVITTYHVLANDAPREAKKIGDLYVPATSGGVLFQAKFRRVILDESQVIKNKNTAASKACGSLSIHADFCFSLSGTPIQNSVDDIYPQFRFIKYPAFKEYEVFNQNFGQKIQKENLMSCRDVILQLQTILKSCLLRRTKANLVVKLPEKEIINVALELTDPEKLFYRAIELKATLVFNKLDKRGIVMKSFSSILVLLLRLRQAATHCHLFKDVWEYALKGEFGLEFMEHTRRRANDVECLVCMVNCELKS